MFPKSIRWRIQLWHGALLVCLVTVMLGTFYVYVRAEKLRSVDDQLESYLTPLMPHLFPPGGGRGFGPPGGPDDGPPDDEPFRGPHERGRPKPMEFGNEQAKGVYYTAWASQGTVVAKTTNSPALTPPRMEEGHHRASRLRDGARELIVFTPDDGVVVLGLPIGPTLDELHRLAWIEALAGVGLVVFGLAGGWWVAGHTLRPIQEIGKVAERIAAGDRARRINVHEADSELGKLATVLNTTFDKLDKAFEQQVHFTADASHELRTPVSVILTQTQLALSRERAAAEYRESLAVCQRAAERMRGLINTLLDLARADGTGFDLTLTDCDLRRMADSAIDLVGTLAAQKETKLQVDVDAIHLKGDSSKLEQVLVNLLQNAILHNPPGTQVCLSIHPKEGYAEMRVSDDGIGIPAEARPRLFDRFFRVDKSRSSATGGSGLGLAICKTIVEAHHGAITLENKDNKGTEFRVLLPLNSNPRQGRLAEVSGFARESCLPMNLHQDTR